MKNPIHPKVKVPAVVGTVIAIVLAVLAGLTAVPSLAPYVAIGVTVVNTAAGYLTYSEYRTSAPTPETASRRESSS